jgi:hypothetical protein
MGGAADTWCIALNLLHVTTNSDALLSTSCILQQTVMHCSPPPAYYNKQWCIALNLLHITTNSDALLSTSCILQQTVFNPGSISQMLWIRNYFCLNQDPNPIFPCVLDQNLDPTWLAKSSKSSSGSDPKYSLQVPVPVFHNILKVFLWLLGITGTGTGTGTDTLK